jgi:hypothetical protein
MITGTALRGIFIYLKIIFATVAIIVFLDSALRYYSALRGDLLSDEVAATAVYPSNYYHPILAYTSVPSFSGFVPLIEPGKVFFVKTNAHGFRTHEFYPKFDATIRIIILGDSFIWGYNANQDETIARVIERLFNSIGQDRVEVLSLGVPSYSGVRYAALSSIYFSYLKPDIVVVALDQSDFEEDLDRAKDYIYSSDGCPARLKTAETAENRESRSRESRSPERIAFDERGKLINIPKFSMGARLRAASGLYDYFAGTRSRSTRNTVLLDKVRSEHGDLVDVKEFSVRKPIRYEDLVKRYGEDAFLKDMPFGIKDDVIPVSLETAKKLYGDTLNSIKCVKKEADKIGARMFITDYPYPYFVSTMETLGRQIQLGLDAPLDFRNDRTYPMLVKYFASQVSVPYLDGYPAIEKDPVEKYGFFDPHFSADGYQTYGSFLFDSIRGDVEELSRRR